MTKNQTLPAERPPYSPKPEEEAAIKKVVAARKVPRLKVENNKFAVDHEDRFTGYALMQDSLGSTSPDFVSGLLNQLAKATGDTIVASDLNFLVSFIQGIEPRDQVESALAAQMAVIHQALMRFMQQLPTIASLPQQDSAERAINKFARTFTTQMEALKRYRSGAEQRVAVTHVSVAEGGQAIVGNVTQGAAEAKSKKVPSPPLALTHSKVAPMKMIDEPVLEAAAIERKSGK